MRKGREDPKYHPSHRYPIPECHAANGPEILKLSRRRFQQNLLLSSGFMNFRILLTPCKSKPCGIALEIASFFYTVEKGKKTFSTKMSRQTKSSHISINFENSKIFFVLSIATKFNDMSDYILIFIMLQNIFPYTSMCFSSKQRKMTDHQFCLLSTCG